MVDRGITYVAINPGAEFLARRSAVSVKEVMPDMHITLFTDQDTQPDRAVMFDRIVKIRSIDSRFPDRPLYPEQGIIAKVRYLYAAGYRLGLFLDVDTYVTQDISHLFDMMEGFHLAAAHCPGRYDNAFYPDVPSSFPVFNTGVVAYRRCPATDRLMARYHRLFTKITAEGVGSADQITLQKALYDSPDIRLCVLPSEYNLRFVFPTQVFGSVYILHGRDDGLEEIATRVNQDKGFRVWYQDRALAYYRTGQTPALEMACRDHR